MNLNSTRIDIDARCCANGSTSTQIPGKEPRTLPGSSLFPPSHSSLGGYNRVRFETIIKKGESGIRTERFVSFPLDPLLFECRARFPPPLPRNSTNPITTRAIIKDNARTSPLPPLENKEWSDGGSRVILGPQSRRRGHSRPSQSIPTTWLGSFPFGHPFEIKFTHSNPSSSLVLISLQPLITRLYALSINPHSSTKLAIPPRTFSAPSPDERRGCAASPSFASQTPWSHLETYASGSSKLHPHHSNRLGFIEHSCSSSIPLTRTNNSISARNRFHLLFCSDPLAVEV